MESSGENLLPENISNMHFVRAALCTQRRSIIMHIPPGQSVIESIISHFEDEEQEGLGIIKSATGSVLNPTIKSHRRTYTYEGSYIIRELEGSFTCTDDGEVDDYKFVPVLRDSDGNDFCGVAVGLLIAATPVQVLINYYSGGARPDLVRQVRRG